MDIKPAPIVVSPSGNFQGNDGSWSSFNISVGTPPQPVQVLAATQIPEIWVVLPGGCADPSNCTDTRGGSFDKIKSSSWISKATYALGAESNLGYTANSDIGNYGFDNVGVGKPGAGNVSVDGQVVAGLLTDDFWLGNLGLASRPMIFDSDRNPQPSFLTLLQNRNLIPSLAYGFTAGASYLGAHASLTLGGYDTSRFTPNDVSFSFAPAPTRQLVVGLKSIVYNDANHKNSPLLSQGIWTLVDSTTPQIWLPLAACQSFEKAFGIIYDPIPNLYLVNSTVHDALLQQNASITFELSNTLNGGPSVQIILPYASFDLEIGPPFARNASKYFPLRRAHDDTQYTLGRTFLQESYLTVNYESSNFSISQSVYGQNTPPRIVPILSTNSTTTDSASPTAVPKQPLVSVSPGHSSQSIGTGAIAGIVVAIVLIILACGALVFYCRPSKRRRRNSTEVPAHPPFPMDAHELENPDFRTEKKDINVTALEMNDPMTPPDEMDATAMFERTSKHELAAGSMCTELESPSPYRPELPSPGHEHPMPELASQGTVHRRSGASSPDPSPIRSRIHSAVLNSPATGWAPSGEPSPESDLISIGSPGPESTWSGAQTLSQRLSQRPPFQRMDSFGPVSATPTRIRSGHRRTDSSNSGPLAQIPTQASLHGGFGSEDPVGPWDTESAGPSGGYYSHPNAQATSSPLLPPSSHEEARAAMSSPEAGSVRSGLTSPPPFQTMFEESRDSSLDIPKSSQ